MIDKSISFQSLFQMAEFHLQDFLLIKKKELLDGIKNVRELKMEEEQLSKEHYSAQTDVRLEIDPENVGHAFAVCEITRIYTDPIFEIASVGRIVIPFYIPNVHSIEELLNLCVSDESFNFQLFPASYIKTIYNYTVESFRSKPQTKYLL